MIRSLLHPLSWTNKKANHHCIGEGDKHGENENIFVDFKAKVVLEIINGVKSSREISMEHNLKPALLPRLKREFLGNSPKISGSDEQRSQDRSRIRKMERLQG